MCQAFFDVRMFGAVMTTGKALCGRVQGPVQLGFSRSARPVLAQEHGLTRITHTGQEDIDKGESTEMGSKHAIPYGLYLGNGRFTRLDGGLDELLATSIQAWQRAAQTCQQCGEWWWRPMRPCGAG